MTESQKKAAMKYAKNHLKRIPLDLPKDYAEELKGIAQSHGMTMSGFIKEAIKEKIARL